MCESPSYRLESQLLPFNLNFFYQPVTANNNLSFRICCENIVKTYNFSGGSRLSSQI